MGKKDSPKGHSVHPVHSGSLLVLQLLVNNPPKTQCPAARISEARARLLLFCLIQDLKLKLKRFKATIAMSTALDESKYAQLGSHGLRFRVILAPRRHQC